MKRNIILLLFVIAICISGCSSSVKNAQSIGGDTIDDTLKKYSEAWANIDYKKYTGEEILPYMTKEGGKIWFEKTSPQYIDTYKKLKTVREFTDAEISEIQDNGDTATAVLVIHSIQKKPDEKVCADCPEKVYLNKISEKWYVDHTEKLK